MQTLESVSALHYRVFTNAKFQEALSCFKNGTIPLFGGKNRSSKDDESPPTGKGGVGGVLFQSRKILRIIPHSLKLTFEFRRGVGIVDYHEYLIVFRGSGLSVVIGAGRHNRSVNN